MRLLLNREATPVRVSLLAALAAGAVLGRPLSVSAQTPAAGSADMVGAWERTDQPGEFKEYMTVRPSGLWLQTRTDPVGGETGKGDTVSCTRMDNLDWVSSGQEAARLTWWRIKDQELHENSGWKSDFVYKRVEDPSKGPLGRLIANGYALGHPVPTHATTRTGTMADFVGAWQADSVQGGTVQRGTQGLFRRLIIVHPDSTMLVVRLQKLSRGADTVTVACGVGERLGAPWAAWRRHGDSLYITPPSDTTLQGFSAAGSMEGITLLLLQNGRLNLYAKRGPKGETYLYESYLPVDLAKQP